eukprot:g2424.t1
MGTTSKSSTSKTSNSGRANKDHTTAATRTTSSTGTSDHNSNRLSLDTELAGFSGSTSVHRRSAAVGARATQSSSATGVDVSDTAVPNIAAASISTPIFQTSIFDASAQSKYDYTRSGNPTRDALQEICRRIEHAEASYAFASGMAALSATLRLLKPGDSVLASRDLYGGMHRLLRHAATHSGLNVRFVETWDLERTRRAFTEEDGRVRMLFVESPTNPMMRVSDVRKLSKLAHDNGAVLCVDNSIMSPVLSTPLDLGADIVVHSATKFMAGHSDVVGGVVAVKDAELARSIAFVQNAEGGGLSPFDAFLVIRGMKTMGIRMRSAQANAVELAEILRQHPVVNKVHYLSPDTTQLDGVLGQEARLHFSQCRGSGAVVSFETGNVEISRAFIEHITSRRGGLFKKTVSFGSVRSLAEIPAEMSHASIPSNEQFMPADLVRMSVGIEDVGDLVRCVTSALAHAQVLDAERESDERLKQAGVDSSSPNLARSASSLWRMADEVVAGATSLPFGVSLPPREDHAVGVSMPTWKDVINYEEGDADALSKMSSGYPRFVFLKPVKELFEVCERLFAAPGESAMALPSARVALRLQQFLNKSGKAEDVRVHDVYAHGVFAVTFPASSDSVAKLFWQHCGEIVSSRLAKEVLSVVKQTCYENVKSDVGDDDAAAAAALDNLGLDHTYHHISSSGDHPDTLNIRHGAGGDGAMELATCSDGGGVEEEEEAKEEGNDYQTARRQQQRRQHRTSPDPHFALRRRIASLADEDMSNTFVYPTGMSAITAAHRLLKLASNWDETPLRNIVFGFPYLDTLKLNGRPEMGGGVVFFGNGDAEDLSALKTLLETSDERFGGLFCEIPSNPLLRAPPLRALRDLANRYGFPLIVDDSIAGFCNVDVLGDGGADILCSSLTKQFSGSNTVMGGSLVLNSRSPLHARLHARLTRDYEPLLWQQDAAVLLSASSDVEARVATSNANAVALVRLLEAHPTVERVYHPLVETKDLYDEWRRDGGDPGSEIGYGALLSVTFKDESNARVFYDRLNAAKGPGFGSNFTLACPYTMIAHFNELDWCRTYGIDPSLIRVWVGLEDRRALLGAFTDALGSLSTSGTAPRKGDKKSASRVP